ncbi:MAG TPA: hypothetical protein VI968_00760 [archaeon]|nr:hypothetical protein [archaeon]
MEYISNDINLELLRTHWKLVSAYRRKDMENVYTLTKKYMELERGLNR